MTTKKSPEALRSARWFAPDDLRGFGHRSRMMQMGYAPADWVGKPIAAALKLDADDKRHKQKVAALLKVLD